MLDTAFRSSRSARRAFLCHAHDDRRRVQRFLQLLEPRLRVLRTVDVDVWSDHRLMLGRVWRAEIRAAIERADIGLVLVSPALLASDFVRTVELPALRTRLGDAVLPVGLQAVGFERSDLQGLEPRQFFLLPGGQNGHRRWFADLAGENRARFCLDLAAQVSDRLAGDLRSS